MERDADEEALRWGPDDEDDSLVAPASLPAEPAEKEPGLVVTAILGGFYVMWGVAWVMGLAGQPPQQTAGVLDAILFGVGGFLAYIATPLWFVAVLWLGATWSVRVKAGVLLVGLVVLLPWPFILPAVM